MGNLVSSVARAWWRVHEEDFQEEEDDGQEYSERDLDIHDVENSEFRGQRLKVLFLHEGTLAQLMLSTLLLHDLAYGLETVCDLELDLDSPQSQVSSSSRSVDLTTWQAM